MVKRRHLEPEQKAEIVGEIMTDLLPQIGAAVEQQINDYAITDEDVALRVMATIENIEPRWFTKLFFKIRPLRVPVSDNTSANTAVEDVLNKGSDV